MFEQYGQQFPQQFPHVLISYMPKHSNLKSYSNPMGKPLPSRNEMLVFSTQYLFYKTLNILVFWAGIVSCTRKLPYLTLH